MTLPNVNTKSVTVTTNEAAIHSAIELLTKDLEESDWLAISSAVELKQASDRLHEIKLRLEHLDTLRKAITRPLDEAKKNTMDLFRPHLEMLEQQSDDLKSAIMHYQREVEAKRRAEEARLRDEREAIRVRAEAEAKALEAHGHLEEAEAVLVAVPPVPVLVVETPRVGLGNRTTWHATVEDLDLFINYAVANYPDLIQVNEKKLGELARATKGSLKIPGVKFYPEEGLVVR